MQVDIIDAGSAPVFRNPGKVSVQLVSPENAPASPVTITRVTMAPDAVSAVHRHDHAEQIWIVEQGAGLLLLADGASLPVSAGQIVRTPPRIDHGLRNTGAGDLVYLAITTPPESMAKFYQTH